MIIKGRVPEGRGARQPGHHEHPEELTLIYIYIYIYTHTYVCTTTNNNNDNNDNSNNKAYTLIIMEHSETTQETSTPRSFVFAASSPDGPWTRLSI